jgi:AcrR family transcriptional regulator
MNESKVAKSERKARTNSHEELIIAGVQAICKHGIDQVTVSTVTSITGHSRPTFYSYFGDVEGMFAEIWITYGPAWFDQLLDFEPREETEWENHLSWAMLQILSIAHRAPEVSEVVIPDVQKWWKANAGKTEVAQLRTSWLLGVQLGVKMARMITPECVLAEQVIPAIRAIPDSLDGTPILDKLAPLPDLSDVPAFLANPLSREDELMQAAAEVVASSGVKAASVARVARKCRVSTGTIYPRFQTGADLLTATFDSAINKVVSANLEHLDTMKNVADQFGYVVIVGQSENRRVWRDFRQEMHLAAMYDHELRKMIRPGFEATRNRLVDISRSAGVIAEEFIDPATWLMHAIAVGLTMLQHAGIAVGKMDHRIVIRFLGSVVSPR